MSHVTFQTVFLQGNAALDTLPSLFTLGIRLYLSEGGSLLAAAALPLRVLVSLTSVHFEAKN